MENKKKSVLNFKKMKGNEKITYVVLYDFHSAKLAEKAGVEMILVGDSVGMSIYGYDGTEPVTMDQMIYHSEAVRRGALNTFIIGDMPFGSYTNDKNAVANAVRFYKEAHVDAIKLEGGRRVAGQIEAIVKNGMNVMGHLGLTPQSSGQLGGFKAQGLTAKSAKEVILDALAVQEAGAFAVLLEAVSMEVGQMVAKALDIPVLSIGAGMYCDGQLLLDVDLLGKTSVFEITFVKKFVNIEPLVLKGFQDYVKEVKAGTFPKEEHCYNMKPFEFEKLLKLVAMNKEDMKKKKYEIRLCSCKK